MFLVEPDVSISTGCFICELMFQSDLMFQAIYEMLGPEVTKSAEDSPRKRAKMIFDKMDVNGDKVG